MGQTAQRSAATVLQLKRAIIQLGIAQMVVQLATMEAFVSRVGIAFLKNQFRNVPCIKKPYT